MQIGPRYLRVTVTDDLYVTKQRQTKIKTVGKKSVFKIVSNHRFFKLSFKANLHAVKNN